MKIIKVNKKATTAEGLISRLVINKDNAIVPPNTNSKITISKKLINGGVSGITVAGRGFCPTSKSFIYEVYVSCKLKSIRLNTHVIMIHMEQRDKEKKDYKSDLLVTTTLFNSPTLGTLSLEHVFLNISEYVKAFPEYNYKIIIGTDSEARNDGHAVDFITAIIVLRVGAGGVYYWKRSLNMGFYTLRDRIYQEALISMDFAQKLLDIVKDEELFALCCNLEIHLDVGQNGRTRDVINEVVGMIRGSGFTVCTKPYSFGASKIADRYT